MPKWLIFDACTLLFREKNLANYALLRCLKILRCKFLDRYHVWIHNIIHIRYSLRGEEIGPQNSKSNCDQRMWIYQNKDDSHEPTTFSRTAGHVTTHISPISQPRTHTSSQQCHSPTHWWGQTVVVSPPLPHKIYIIRRAWAHRVTQNATIPDKNKNHEICKRRILKYKQNTK